MSLLTIHNQMIMKPFFHPLRSALVLLVVFQLLPAVGMAEVSYRISYLPVVSTDFPNAFIGSSAFGVGRPRFYWECPGVTFQSRTKPA